MGKHTLSVFLDNKIEGNPASRHGNRQRWRRLPRLGVVYIGPDIIDGFGGDSPTVFETFHGSLCHAARSGIPE